MYIFDSILLVLAVLALIAVVTYIVFSINQANQMRPPTFVRQFSVRPTNGCPGTEVTIDWETMDTSRQTLTRSPPAVGDGPVAQGGPIRERPTATTIYSFIATKPGHTDITGTGTFTLRRDGDPFDIQGQAHCETLQGMGGINTPVWQFGEDLGADWHEGVKVRSVTLLTAPAGRTLSVVHDRDFAGATELTEAAPTVNFTDPVPLARGRWLIFVPRMQGELCSPNDPGPGVYQPFTLGVRLTLACR